MTSSLLGVGDGTELPACLTSALPAEPQPKCSPRGNVPVPVHRMECYRVEKIDQEFLMS